MAYDLPAGGKRLLQGARGYRATVVSGTITYRDGEATGAAARPPRTGRPRQHRSLRREEERWPRDTLRELEPAAEWRAADVGDPASWTLRLSDEDQEELDRRAGHGQGQEHATRSTSARTTSRSTGWPESCDGVVDVLLNGRGFMRIATLDSRTLTATRTSRSSTGASACISASPGPRTSTAMCWATSPTRARRSTTRPCGATSSAGSRSTTTPTVRIWSACSACARHAAAASPAWPTRWPSTTSWCASIPTWRPPSTSRCRTTPAASRPRAPTPFYAVPAFTEHAERLFVRFIPQYILASQRHPDAPRLSHEARTAIALVSEMANDSGLQRLHGSAAR